MRFLTLITGCLLGLCCCGELFAQREPRAHLLYRDDLPPGHIGRIQAAVDSLRRGYFQPVRVFGPEGSAVSLAVEGRFAPSQSSSALAGMLLGQVYHVKVTRIPNNEGREVYPTIEVIDRLHPPPGLETKFPIPIHVSQEELELALEGFFITRVIYLENPRDAIAVRENPDRQRYFEVHPKDDPIAVADQLGRPVAILRLGSRIPSAGGQMGAVENTPPLMLYQEQPAAEEVAPPPALPRAESRIPSDHRTNVKR